MTRRPLPTFFVLGLAACISIAFVQQLKPTGTAAAVFWSLWLALPYIAMGAALRLSEGEGRAPMHWQAAAALVSIAGVFYLADTIVWRPDAQGGIAVLMTPILQAGLAAVLAPIVWFSSRIRRG